MAKNQGTLFYNYEENRMDVKYEDGSTYGGLHCGTTMEVKINVQWIQTRIEKSDDWYLVDVSIDSLEGLSVRL